jgi:Uncharacterised protein family (UPF0158)
MTAARKDQMAPAPVRLHELIDAVEAQSDTVSFYLDRTTGAIYTISQEAFDLAEDDTAEWDRIPDWQREEVQCARNVSGSDRYLALPTSWDIHEWAIMQKFASSIPDTRLTSQLLDTIRGSGAFQRFKGQLTHHDLWEAWNDFRRDAIRHRLIEWCEEHGTRFVP